VDAALTLPILSDPVAPSYASERRPLARMIEESAHHAYVYGYPHKTAYRPLPPRSIAEIWACEPKDAIALYLHVPFCEFRCGFCNLFTTHGADRDDARAFLDALERQVAVVAREIGPVRVEAVAIGGGTPTWLTPGELERALRVLEEFGCDPGSIASAIEVSPRTMTADHLALLRERGFERVSIGVQSFSDRVRKALGRPEPAREAHDALRRLRGAGFPRVNVDLIYGAEAQTDAELEADLRAVLAYEPDELYLYPLYVRPKTGLARRARASADRRPAMYALARELLSDAGFEAISMRNFARRDRASRPSAYRCDRGPTIGLGPGARSYTRALHYSDEWAVSAGSVRTIVAGYLDPARDFSLVRHGFALDANEQKRRRLLQGLLQCEGLSIAEYRAEHGSAPADDFPELAELFALGLATESERLVLTERGLALSDAIGPWLFSDAVRAASAEYEVR
jgi:oxygen-independent coproporphyrinogen-3 oxidase